MDQLMAAATHDQLEKSRLQRVKEEIAYDLYPSASARYHYPAGPTAAATSSFSSSTAAAPPSAPLAKSAGVRDGPLLPPLPSSSPSSLSAIQHRPPVRTNAMDDSMRQMRMRTDGRSTLQPPQQQQPRSHPPASSSAYAALTGWKLPPYSQHGGRVRPSTRTLSASMSQAAVDLLTRAPVSSFLVLPGILWHAGGSWCRSCVLLVLPRPPSGQVHQLPSQGRPRTRLQGVLYTVLHLRRTGDPRLQVEGRRANRT